MSMNGIIAEYQRRIDVMQAYAGGAAVECCRRGAGKPFISLARPVWSWEDCDYRVKPEPREWWFNMYVSGCVGAFCGSKKQADDAALPGRIECVQVREVI